MALQVGDKAIWRPWTREAPAWVLPLLERAVKADTEKESGKE